MVNFGPLAAEIRLPVRGTPANFNTFCVLASLLDRRRSTEVNQTLNDVRPSSVLAQYIYTSARCKIHFESKSCIHIYWQRYCTALEQWASAKLCSVVQGMELRNFRSSSFSTDGATYITREAIAFGIGPHSGSLFSAYVAD